MTDGALEGMTLIPDNVVVEQNLTFEFKLEELSSIAHTKVVDMFCFIHDLDNLVATKAVDDAMISLR